MLSPSIMRRIGGDTFFTLLGKFSYKAKTLGGMRTRLIGKALGAASLQADSLFHQIGFIMGS